MAEGEGRYNPIGYHVGTVWPFDNSFIAWGLRRYGFKEEAAQIAAGILDAAVFFEGRLPEAFARLRPQSDQVPGRSTRPPAALRPGRPERRCSSYARCSGSSRSAINSSSTRRCPAGIGTAGAARHPRSVGARRRLRTRPDRPRRTALSRPATRESRAPRPISRWSTQPIALIHQSLHTSSQTGEQRSCGTLAFCSRDGCWARVAVLCPNSGEFPQIATSRRAVKQARRASYPRSTMRGWRLAGTGPRPACHAEGRGFESHHPLDKSPAQRGFRFSPRATDEPCCKRNCKRTLSQSRVYVIP